MLEERDLGTGNEGKGPVGGAIDGLDGRGRELPDMVWVRLRVSGWCSVLAGWRSAVAANALLFPGRYGAAYMSVGI